MRARLVLPSLGEPEASIHKGIESSAANRGLAFHGALTKILNSTITDVNSLSIPPAAAGSAANVNFRLPYCAKPRVILLQGPVGPFLRHLQDSLERSGFDVWRIIFNAGDRLFASGKKQISFKGGREAWSGWFRSFITIADADHLILFGAEREVHAVARAHAQALGVSILSLEEGYLRPGFVTIEQGANNWLSPIAGKLPPDSFQEGAGPGRASDGSKAFRIMCAYGALYYTVSTLFSLRRQRQLSHRQIQLLPEAFAWARNYYRRLMHQSGNFSIIGSLLEHQVGRYFIIPLQIASDTQMRCAALGWSNERLIAETLASFASTAPRTHRLVFKIHPLERGHRNDAELIRKTARSLGVSDRVDIVDTGSIGLLTRHSAGMITINSTSGLSAIFHGVPLLVVGNAFYANSELAICAWGTPDFDSFWRESHVADEAFRQRYLAWIREMCLRPGNFYEYQGIVEACEGILNLLKPSMAVNSNTARAV